MTKETSAKETAEYLKKKGWTGLAEMVGQVDGNNSHSTCPSCNKLIPNQHFDCHRSIKEAAYEQGRAEGRKKR